MPAPSPAPQWIYAKSWRQSVGRRTAQFLCLLFGFVGLLPLILGLVLHTNLARRWAEQRTARILRDELGVDARYRATVALWPLSLEVDDLMVPSRDGGPPALTVDRIQVMPHLFSLMAGHLDAGDVAIDRPRARLVFINGALTNLAYHLPKVPDTPRKKLERAPFRSVSITEATVVLDVDARHIETGPIDVDVSAEAGPALELSVHAGESQMITRGERRVTNAAPFPAVDEDVLCEMDARVRVAPTEILVRRLALFGRADLDPAPNTRPTCTRIEEDQDPSQVALRVTELRASLGRSPPEVEGQILVRAPIPLTNRFVPFLPTEGWVGLNGKLRWDGKTKLPSLKARIRGGNIKLERYALGRELSAEVSIADDAILVSHADIGIADGHAIIHDARIRPFEPGIPIATRRVDTVGVQFPGLMRDLGVTPATVVAWEFGETSVTNLGGRLALPELEGHLSARTHGFEVTTRAFNDPARRHMIGVPHATIEGRFLVRPDAVQFRDTRARFGKSELDAQLVSIGFDNQVQIVVGDQSVVELSDISPLAAIPWSGRMRLGVRMEGMSGDPRLTGNLAIQDFSFGGFGFGDITSSEVKFRPLKLELSQLKAKKGQSEYQIPSGRLDFDQAATLVVDAQAQSQRFDIRDFLNMWNLDQDPRYAEISGSTTLDARVNYVLGGPADRCQDGVLKVDGRASILDASLFGERYDGGEASLSLNWADRRAGFLGFTLDVPSFVLRKRAGVLLGSLRVSPGAVLQGQAIATSLPLSRFDSLGTLGTALEGEASGTAILGGTLDAISAQVHVDLSPVRLGMSTLPASQLDVTLEPAPRRLRSIGTSRCGQPIPAAFDLAEYDEDRSDGSYRVDGKMFGGQVLLEALRFTRQRDRRVTGRVQLRELDLGGLGDTLAMGLDWEQRMSGAISGTLTIDELATSRPTQAKARFDLSKLVVSRGTTQATVTSTGGSFEIAQNSVAVPGLLVALGTGKGGTISATLAGSVTNLERDPLVSAQARLSPVSLQRFISLYPSLSRLEGQLSGELWLTGPLSHPTAAGQFSIRDAEIGLRRFELPLTDGQVDLAIANGELRIERAQAHLGTGTVELTGSAPLVGFALGTTRLGLRAKDIALPSELGISGVVDAQLETLLDPSLSSIRPRITGQVTLDGVEYTRQVALAADVNTLAQRGRRSEVSAYDPADDVVDLDLVLLSKNPLRIRNGLIEADMDLGHQGLELLGTNQRFGLRGIIRTLTGGRIHLRQHVFEIREGVIRFDDVTRIAPRVDVRAVTEYRRYSSQAGAGQSTASPAPGASAGGSAGATQGRWRITMHAHGDTEQLRIDLTSEPALSQDDIFLLLTVGVTRTELDQAQNSSVGESVVLETLGTMSGADRAVTDTIPIIDDFRFGSAYSSRTGRTEPTVTIGKRLAERIRASVTSGLAETREVRSNVEWKLSPQLSIEGSYDNVNDISSSQLGNLGADVRWRIEFQ